MSWQPKASLSTKGKYTSDQSVTLQDIGSSVKRVVMEKVTIELTLPQSLDRV